MHSNTKKEILRFDRPVPRYTSYPTAPHFKPGSDDDQYKTWLRGLPADAKLSLYFHLPFCPKLCWFCGCNTKITKRYEPIEDYLHLLIREIEMVGKFLTKNQKITNIHFGGGSPTILRAYDFALLMRRIHDVFNIAQNAEIAIEVDPRQMNEAKAAIYAKAGVTRASLGAPDFDEKVLKSVNRSQPFHVSYETVKILRDYGIKNINLDLMHGLPYQTTETMKRSAEYALLLKPDRIALFGYAHVPWIKKHMRLMPEEELPDAGARFDLFECAKAVFVKNDYAPVGIDHFTKPNDSLAKAMRNKTLRRNFQGYTDDNADALIGFGASAITKFPSGFSQNALQIHNYRDHILSDKLPVEKYCLLSAEDKLREEIIQSLMCALSVDTRAICAKHGYEHDLLNRAFRELQPLKISGLIKINYEGVISILAPQAARLVSAAFDAYLQPADQGATPPRHVTTL